MIAKRCKRNSGQQILAIFLVVFTIIMSADILVSKIMHNQLLDAAEKHLGMTELVIREGLLETQATVVNTGITLVHMIEDGCGQDEIIEYMQEVTQFLINGREPISGINGIYGYIDGAYLDGFSWEPDDNYNPQERPWYAAAIGREGKIAYSHPYKDEMTGVMVVSVSKELNGANGESYGVVAVDVVISNIIEHVRKLKLTDNGYGLLLDKDFNILYNENPDHAGEDRNVVAIDKEQLASVLVDGEPVLGKQIRDTDGRAVIVNLRNLHNNWYLGIVTPVNQYFADLKHVMIILGSGSVVLLTVLCIILHRLNKAWSQAEDESRSRKSFLAHVSHEVRTPMNSIIGMSELALRDETITDSVFDNVYAIYQSGVNLLALINNILDVSTIESGKMEIITAPYRINTVLNEAFNVIKVRMDKRKVRFAMYVSAQMPSTLIGDEIRIRQILLNILSNAVKYTRSGCIVLSISGEYRTDSEFLLKIQVEDTGIGIKEEDMEALFQEFSRVDKKKNYKVEGTGLGLVITKYLCQIMSGTIHVESKYGSGSVFTVEIPQQVKERKKLAAVEPDRIEPVLILEDNAKVARTVQRTFLDFSISATVVIDEDEFVKYLKLGRYGWVFTPYEKLEFTKKWIQRCGVDVKLVEMVPCNWTPHNSVMSVILPVYSVPVANVLNGLVTTDVVQLVEKEGRLIAPEARVLIVDDIRVNLKVAEGMLAHFKIKADTCLSGKEAIRRVQEKDYDLVLLDYIMPEMDGVETAREIRALPDSRFQELTIIALTANEVSGIRELLLGSGMNDYLAKPIELRNLHYILEKWLPKDIQQENDEPDIVGENCDNELLITGINTGDGIKRFGGDKKAYLQMLNYYALHTPKLLLQIHGCTEQLDQYATAVHGLKGSSYYICAYEVGSYAQYLEQEAKAGNKDAVTYQTAVLLTLTNTLIEHIRQALGQDLETPGRKVAVAPDQNVLRQLEKYCHSYDIQGMEQALVELEEYQYENDGDLIPRLRTGIEELEYDEVLIQLNDYLNRTAKDF
ncbi:MAG: ATP-binding protein [Lachnospiraceae bacterium]